MAEHTFFGYSFKVTSTFSLVIAREFAVPMVSAASRSRFSLVPGLNMLSQRLFILWFLRFIIPQVRHTSSPLGCSALLVAYYPWIYSTQGLAGFFIVSRSNLYAIAE